MINDTIVPGQDAATHSSNPHLIFGDYRSPGSLELREVSADESQNLVQDPDCTAPHGFSYSSDGAQPTPTRTVTTLSFECQRHGHQTAIERCRIIESSLAGRGVAIRFGSRRDHPVPRGGQFTQNHAVDDAAEEDPAGEARGAQIAAARLKRAADRRRSDSDRVTDRLPDRLTRAAGGMVLVSTAPPCISLPSHLEHSKNSVPSGRPWAWPNEPPTPPFSPKEPPTPSAKLHQRSSPPFPSPSLLSPLRPQRLVSARIATRCFCGTHMRNPLVNPLPPDANGATEILARAAGGKTASPREERRACTCERSRVSPAVALLVDTPSTSALSALSLPERSLRRPFERRQGDRHLGGSTACSTPPPPPDNVHVNGITRRAFCVGEHI